MKSLILHCFYFLLCAFAFYEGTKVVPVSTYATRGPASDSYTKKVLGAAEMVSLGNDKFFDIKAKVDSGAETSSLHAENIRAFTKTVNGAKKTFVTFTTEDDYGKEIEITKEVLKIDVVKSASGASERYFIRETVWVGDNAYDVEVNLTDRSHLSRKFLIGKNVLKKGQYLIDVGHELIALENQDY